MKDNEKNKDKDKGQKKTTPTTTTSRADRFVEKDLSFLKITPGDEKS